MKNTILIAATILNAIFANAQGLKIEVQNKKDPLTVMVVGSKANTSFYQDGICYIDENDKCRIHIGTFGQQRYMGYFNSYGLSRDGDKPVIENSDFRTLQLALKLATPSCPVTLTIDRQTTTVIGLKATCDYLAAADSEPNAG